MSLPWFRMYSEAVDDAKLRLLAFEDRWHFVALLCCKCQGVLDTDPHTLDRRIAIKLGLQSLESEKLKNRLMEVGLITDDWQPIAWEKRQFVSDTDPTRAERQARYREKHMKRVSNALRNGQVTRVEQNRTDTEQNRSTTRQISNEISTPVLQEKKNGVPYEQIVRLYHAKLPELPKCVKITNQRKGYIRQRWLEDLPDIPAWERYFDIIRQSKFLMGQVKGSDGRPPFRADLSWLCRPENIVKVIEGKYHRA